MGFRTTALRLLYATLAATAIVALASEAILTTTAPRLLSLILEPLSLLLMPGLTVSLITAGPHDYSPNTVLLASFLFYVALFFFLLHRRQSRR